MPTEDSGNLDFNLLEIVIKFPLPDSISLKRVLSQAAVENQ